MPHPELDNQTPFAFTPLLLADEDGRPLVAPVVKATFEVSASGETTLVEEQPEVNLDGEYNSEPGESSYRLEPEVAFTKLSTDVVLLGHAMAPKRGTTELEVRFRVGRLEKTARVTGDRYWESGFLGTKASKPKPFDKIPLTYEYAFGGWDRTAEDPEKHDYEPRNPVGLGFVARHGKPDSEVPLPNIEDPGQPLKSPGKGGIPIGLGFVSPGWQPRAGLAGTYDEAWTETRSPLLPKDFDRRFFSAASEGLIAPGYLRGDEKVEVEGATRRGRWTFRLPAIEAPQCTVALRFGEDLELTTNLDTVIVDADAKRLTLLWRTFTLLRTGPHDLAAIRVTCANAPAPPALASVHAEPSAPGF